MTGEALLRAIVANPADDLPRLVYADWLDEHGDPARAEFVRVQCDLARTDETDPRYRHLEDREHDLLSEHEPKWLDAGADRWHEWAFRRGFVEQITAPAGVIPSEATANTLPRDLHLVSEDRPGDIAVIPLFDFAESLDLSAWHEYGATADVFLTRREWPRLTDLNLSHRPGLTRLPELLSRCPFQDRLTGLAFGGRTGSNFAWADGENETLDAAGLAALAVDVPLEQLAAFDCGLTADGLWRLLGAFGPRLTTLDISDNPVAAAGWRGFREFGPKRLARLDVSGTALASGALEPLVASSLFNTVTELTMNRTGISRADLDAVVGSGFWARATAFRAHASTVMAYTLDPLCTADAPDLRHLDLSDNHLRLAGVVRLASAPWAASLGWLSLSQNDLDDDAFRLLADGPFRTLRTLHLGNVPGGSERPAAPITPAGMRALAGFSSAANLRILTLGFTEVGDAGVDLALNAPHWRLSGLGVAGCDLSPDAVRILAESPRLHRLEWLDLSTNPRLSGDALLPLAESPYLSRLCELDVSGIYVGERTRQALRERLGRRLSS